MEINNSNDAEFEAALTQQDALNAQMGVDEEMANLAIVDDADKASLELMLEKAEKGLEPLLDDPTVRAAINALLMEKQGVSTDELDEYELPSVSFQVDDAEVAEHTLTSEQTEQLLSTLKARFEANKKRHKGIEWSQVKSRLNEAASEKLWSLNEMERTGGEPDVLGLVEETGEYEFWDCSKESPEGRRSVCYDRQGQAEAERQGYNPKGNAVDMAETMGMGGILNEGQYRKLQKLGKFDLNTWSWIDTPEETRERGVALDANRSYIDVAVSVGYPNNHDGDGAFRGWLRV